MSILNFHWLQHNFFFILTGCSDDLVPFNLQSVVKIFFGFRAMIFFTAGQKILSVFTP